MSPKSMILVVMTPSLLKYFHEEDIANEDLKIYLYYLLQKNNIEILAGQLNGNCPVHKLSNLEIVTHQQVYRLAAECPADTLEELVIYQPQPVTGQYSPVSPTAREMYQRIITELENMQVAEKVVFIREDIKFDPENISQKAIFNNKKQVTVVT